MELFYIFKYKFLILKHRVQMMPLIYKLALVLGVVVTIPIIFITNILSMKIAYEYYKFNASDYFFVVSLINALLILLMIPYLIRKSYVNNFNLDKEHILYTSPLSLKTIFLYKFITTNNRVVITFLIITVPNIISYGIINNSSIIKVIGWIILTIILLIVVSTLIQLLTVITAVLIKAKYRYIFVNIMASIISVMSIISFLALGKIASFKGVFNYLKTSTLIHKTFFVFDLWNKIVVDIDLGKINIVSTSILLGICIGCMIIFFNLYKLIYLKGEFISICENSNVKSNKDGNIFYFLLKKIFRNNYILIYKDFLILARSIEKWGVILTPVVFTPLPFLGSDNFFDYKNIGKLLIIFFIWLSSDLAFYAIKSEGSMLKDLKNSSFNIVNIIYSKIAFSSIISIIIYIVINIMMCLFLHFSCYQLLVLGVCIISIILTTNTICTSLAMLYSQEKDSNNEKDGVTLTFVGEALAYLLVIIVSGIIITISIFSLYLTSILSSSLLSFIAILLFSSLLIICTVLFLKFFTRRVSKKVNS